MKIEDFLFVVSIQRTNQRHNNGLHLVCGGSVIYRDVVLTAAHCVSWTKKEVSWWTQCSPIQPSELVVLAGIVALSNDCA